MRPFHFILAVLLFAGCATRSEVGRHEACAAEVRAARTGLTVSDVDGAAGYGWHIEFDGCALQVVTTSDYEGDADQRVWGRQLTGAERAFLSERIEQASRLPLRSEYRDPEVWDGMQLYFELRPAGRPPRSIDVENRFVEELAWLTDAVNALTPPEYRVRYREWKVEDDRFRKQVEEDRAAHAADEGPG